MSGTPIGHAAALAALRKACAAAGGQAKFARLHGVTPVAVHEALHGTQLTHKIAALIGLERVAMYRKKSLRRSDKGV